MRKAFALKIPSVASLTRPRPAPRVSAKRLLARFSLSGVESKQLRDALA
jgi:hypothetical protein